jgi:hypothetical protein
VRETAPLQAGWVPEIEVNLWVKLQQACLFTPPLLAAVLGCGRRRPGSRGQEFALDSFTATLPAGSGFVVGARIGAAVWSTFAAWVVMLAFVMGWLSVPGHSVGRSAPLLGLLAERSSPAEAAALLLVVAVLVLWTWKNQVQGMAADLSGRGWILYGVPAAAHTAALVGLIGFSTWSRATVPAGGGPAPLPEWTGGLMLLALGLKGIGSAWAARSLLRRRLVRPRTLCRLLAGWAGTALLVWAAAVWLAQEGAEAGPAASLLARTYLPPLAPGFPVEVREPLILAGITLLFLPLTRLLLAPLSLEWSRRR